MLQSATLGCESNQIQFEMSQVIDEMLAGLASARQTMQRQVTKVSEVMDKSNKTLLRIESNNALVQLSTPPNAMHPLKAFSLQAECELALVKIIENFQQLMQQTVDSNVRCGALDDCLAYRQRVEYLGSNVRKLVALCDAIAQMRLNLQDQHSDNEDEELDDDVDY